MSKDSKKHHFLPQSYLKGFQIPSDKNSKIFVYNKKFVKKAPYVASIKDTACICDYHTLQIANKRDRNVVEQMFSDIENCIIQNIRTIVDTHEFTDEIKYILATTILFFKFRVPQNLELYRKYFRRMLEEIAENNFRYDNSGLKGCFSDNFKINVNNNLTVYTILRAICNEKAISSICSRNFSLLEAPQNSYFLCSDSPVSYYVSNYSGCRGVALSAQNLEIFLPLNKSYGLLCSSQNMPVYRKISESELTEYNRRTIIRADQYIYSSINSLEIKELIINNLQFFSGFIYKEIVMNEGMLQFAADIPVTDYK